MNSEVEYHYILTKGTKKQFCPACNMKTFVPYVDTVTGEILQGSFGRCDREVNCGYFEKPPPETLASFVAFESFEEITDKAVSILQNGKKYFIPKKAILERLENGLYVAEYFLKDPKGKRETECPIYETTNGKYFAEGNEGIIKQIAKAKPKQVNKLEPIPLEVLQGTLANYEKNQFIQNLLQNVAFPFNAEDVEKVVSLYYLGTVQNGFREGAITFPFINQSQAIRAIQVKEFDKANHTKGTGFLHSLMVKEYEDKKQPLPDWLKAYQNNASKVSCLFGEHLLNKYPGKPIALVEAPKTAIYGTLYFGFPEEPEAFIWIAVYNKSSFNLEKVKALQGRKIFTFPDLSRNGSTFKEWQAKAKEIEAVLPNTRFIFSTLLENLATESDKEKGKDIADFLIKLNWKDFRDNETDPENGICEKGEKSEGLKTTFILKNGKRIEGLGIEIRELEEAISNQQTEIERLESECKAMEQAFIQASKDCQKEWFIPKWIGTIKGETKLQTILYYCS